MPYKKRYVKHQRESDVERGRGKKTWKPKATVYCSNCGRNKVSSTASFFKLLCPKCKAIKEKNKRDK